MQRPENEEGAGITEVKGQAALEALTVLAEHLDWIAEHEMDRHGKQTAGTVPLRRRLEEDQFEMHAGKRPATETQREGDHFGLIVRHLLQQIQTWSHGDLTE